MILNCCNLPFTENLKLFFDFNWKLRKGSNGKEYIDITQYNMTLLDLGFMSLRFENLFNGDRLLGKICSVRMKKKVLVQDTVRNIFTVLLGENMNNFMNENWRDLARDLAPAVVSAIGDVFGTVFKNICDIVPYDIIFKS